jgi:N-methylhydantoinase B/oxoprolinase/acetone carboxylase alpha subunit
LLFTESNKIMTCRLYPPIGLHGGLPGKTGVNSLIRRDGATEHLSGCVELQLNAGDVLVIETPGGGGFGGLGSVNESDFGLLQGGVGLQAFFQFMIIQYIPHIGYIVR